MQRGLKVRAALGARPTIPEQSAEEVAQITDVARLEVEVTRPRRGTTEAGRGGTEPTDLVVLLALGGVAQDVVGNGDLLEALLRPRIRIGMVRFGEFAVGARDLLVRRTRRHP